MRRPMLRLQDRHRVLAGGLLLLSSLVGCTDFARMLTPGSRGESGPALVSLATSVAASISSASEVVTLKVVAQYLRRDQSAVLIGAQTLPLSSNATQQLPISVDLASCLADADRELIDGLKNSCSVLLNLALVVDNVVVDEQVIGPLRLAPGATTAVPKPVSLFSIATVDVLLGDEPVSANGITGVVGGTLTVSARIRDRNGQAVSERSVLWSSDAPTVATIGAASGTVSVVGLGTARLTATVGRVSQTINFRAVRPSAALTIIAGSSSGSGTIRSTPAGIECRVVGTTVSGACSFIFPGDALVQLTSSAENGSVLALWGDACAGTDVGALCRVTMSQPQTTSVRFSALRRVSIAADGGDGRGRVTGASGLDCRLNGEQTSGVCAVDLEEGTSLTLTATPDVPTDEGGAQVFGGWGGACTAEAGDSCRLLASGSNHEVKVRFFSEQQLRLNVAGSGSGRISWGDGTFCTGSAGVTSGVCARGSTFGTTVTLTAITDAKSTFTGWGGDCEQAVGASCTTTLKQSRSITATFSALRRITVGVGAGDGRGRVTGASGLDCRFNGGQTTGVCSVDIPDGSSIALTAAADPPNGQAGVRQFFAGWGGSCGSETGATCTVVATGGDRSVLVRFFDGQALHLLLAGTGVGRVVWDDGAVCSLSGGANSGTCARLNVFGSTVTLSAIADAQSVFSGWSGCERQVGNSCTTTLTQKRSLSATFTKKRVTLTLTIAGAAPGALTLDGQTACALLPGQSTTNCVLTYDIGTPVTIRGLAATGARFTGFGGDCAGASTCALVLSGASTVTARFDPQQFTLTLQASGAGAGSVTLDGAQFCSLARGDGAVSCTRLIDYGRTVQLVGTAGVGTALLGLDGDCAGANPCSIRVTQDAQIRALFDNILLKTSVVLVGPGEGSVTTLGAIACTRKNRKTTGTCSEDLAFGTTVTFTATAVAPSMFVGWGGACKGQVGLTCTLPLTKGLTVGAEFEKLR